MFDYVVNVFLQILDFVQNLCFVVQFILPTKR